MGSPPGSHRFRRLRRSAVSAGAAAIFLAVGPYTSAAAPPSAAGPVAPVHLGSLGAYGILAGAGGITSSGSTLINGDVGSSSTILGFPPGRATGSLHVGGAVPKTARSDLGTAVQDAAGRVAGAAIAGGVLGGKVIPPGVYRAPDSMTLAGTLTLDGGGDLSAVFLFQAASLTTAAASAVELVGGAQPCNVFWQVAGSAALGADSRFAGTILAGKSISMVGHLELIGRAIASSGGITMINDAVLQSACARPGPTAPPAGAPAAIVPLSAAPSLGTAPGLAVERVGRVVANGQGLGSGPTAILALVVLPVAIFATRRWWRPIRLRRGGRPAARLGEAGAGVPGMLSDGARAGSMRVALDEAAGWVVGVDTGSR